MISIDELLVAAGLTLDIVSYPMGRVTCQGTLLQGVYALSTSPGGPATYMIPLTYDLLTSGKTTSWIVPPRHHIENFLTGHIETF